MTINFRSFCAFVCSMLVYIISFSQDPTYGDCLGALPICDSIYVEVISPDDDGNFDDEIHEDCCISNEQNSIWYKFRIKITGNLGFTIIPNDPLYDYDWALFNITDRACEDIADDFSMITSCNAAGGVDYGYSCYGNTGPNGGTEFNFQNANCGVFPPTLTSDGWSPENDFVPVVEGEVYALLVLEFTDGVTQGFTIDLTDADDVGIYDEERPDITAIDMIYDGCEIIGFTVEFTEEIVCSSFEIDDLNILVDGDIPLATLSSAQCDNSELSSFFTVSFQDPIPVGTELAVSSNEDPNDLCLNPIFEFQFTEISGPTVDTIDSPIVQVCEGVLVELEPEFGSEFSTIDWSTGEDTETITVGAGTYEATLVGACQERLVRFEVLEAPVPEFELDFGESFCDMDVELSILANDDYLYMVDDMDFTPLGEIPAVSPGTHTLTVSNNGCDTTFSFTILVEERLIDTIIQAQVTTCSDEFAVLGYSSPDFSILEWSTGEMTDSIEAGPGMYEAFMVGNCEDLLVQFEVVEIPLPEVEIEFDESVCGSEVEVVVIPTNDLLFVLDDVEIVAGENFPLVSAGVHTLLVTNDLGCDTLIEFTVQAIDSDFDISGLEEYEIISGDSVNMTVFPNDSYDTLNWFLDGVLVCESCEELEVSPTITTTYTVIGIDELGCIVIKTIIVRVENEYDIYVPNIFSPNQDGINDRFVVFGNEFFEELELLEIYDRWGERVYQGVNIAPGDVNDGWDGTFKNRAVQTGVYTWIARVRFLDQTREQLVGTVTVVR